MGTLKFGIATILMAASQLAVAHGGGLNAEGCHNNRKTGDYHCHRAPAVTATSAAKSTNSSGAANNTAAPTPTMQPSAGPTCYVGPRGGTYTITKSGRKNYGGC